MTEAAGRVLVVDDDAAFAGLVTEALTAGGFEASYIGRPLEALARASSEAFEVAVLDLVMPAMGGMELAEKLKAASPDTQVIILTGQGGMDSAVKGIHLGVFDYLSKGSLDLALLDRTVRRAAERAELLRQNRVLMDRLKGSNARLKALHEMAAVLASESHLDRLLARLVSSAKEICGAATGRALLLERTHDEGFVVTQTAGDGASSMTGVRLATSEGIVAHVAAENARVLLRKASEHGRYSRRSDEMPTDLTGFLCVPIRHRDVLGALTLAGSLEGGAFREDDLDALAILGRQGAVAVENVHFHESSLNFFTHVSELLVTVLETLDVFYKGHSRAVALLADMVTRRLGLGEPERRTIHLAALLHDIGKIRIDPNVLQSTSQSPEEIRRLMREHPALGLEILKPITVLEDILPSVHAHHERWDGLGYPMGLSGEQIPLGARVIAVADAFDAMTRDTPHGKARTAEEGFKELEAFAGSQFDPRVVRLFVAEYRIHGHQIQR